MRYIRGSSNNIPQDEYLDMCEEMIDDGEEFKNQLQQFADELANIINSQIGKYTDKWKYFGNELLEPDVLDWFADLDDDEAQEYYNVYDEFTDICDDLQAAGEKLETNIDKLRTIVGSLRYLDSRRA